MRIIPLRTLFLSFCFTLLTVPTLAFAECEPCPECEPCTDCESCEEEADPHAWKKSIAAGFNHTDGNSESTLLNLRAKASRDDGEDVWIFDLEQGWGETTDSETGLEETTVDFTKGLVSYQHLFTPVWYVGATIEAMRDDVADIKYRAIPGVMLGHYFVKDDDLKFSVEAGPSYVFEEQGGIENDYFAPKVGDRFEWQFSKTSKIFQTASVVFDTDDSENYLVRSEVGLNTNLTSMLDLVLSVSNTYDNVPAEDKERNDTIIVSALSVNL